jgi:hypothetical protein
MELLRRHVETCGRFDILERTPKEDRDAARGEWAAIAGMVITTALLAGARNGVVTKDGAVYVAHSSLGQLAGLIVVSPARTAAAGQ